MQPPGVLLAVLFALAGAGEAPAGAPAVRVKVVGQRPAKATPVSPTADALALYQQRCAACHGDKGQGDGPAAAGLMVKPRRFADAFWQDAESDLHLAKGIVEGGFAVKRSSAMPAHPDLKDRAAALVLVVRSFRSPTGSVAVQAVRENGEVCATFTAEADQAGAGVVEVGALPKDAVALIGRISGHPDPVCRLAIAAGPLPRDSLCAAAPTPPQEPR